MSLNPVSLGIGGALSLAGMAYSAIKGGQAMRANERLIDEQAQDNEAWYQSQRNYLDTTEGKSAIEQARQAYAARNRMDQQAAVVTGATDEAQLAARGQANTQLNDLYRQMASQGSQYARQNEGIYRQNIANTYAQRMGVNQMKAQQAANMGQNIGNLMGTAAYAGVFDRGAFKKE